MALTIYRKDNRFRIQGQEISLDWLADTRANRKAAVVFLRLLSDNQGQPLFPHKQLAQIGVFCPTPPGYPAGLGKKPQDD